MDGFKEINALGFQFYFGKIYGLVCIFLAVFLIFYKGFIFVGDAASYAEPVSNFGVPSKGFFYFFLSGDFLVEGVGRGTGIFLLAITSIAMIFEIRLLQKIVFYLTFTILALLFIPMLVWTELMRLCLCYFLFLFMPQFIKLVMTPLVSG